MEILTPNPFPDDNSRRPATPKKKDKKPRRPASKIAKKPKKEKHATVAQKDDSVQEISGKVTQAAGTIILDDSDRMELNFNKKEVVLFAVARFAEMRKEISGHGALSEMNDERLCSSEELDTLFEETPSKF